MFTEFQVFLDKIRNIFFQVDGFRKIYQIFHVVILSGCLVFSQQTLHAALCPGESLLQFSLYVETSGFGVFVFDEIPVSFVKPGNDHCHDIVRLVEIGRVDDTDILKLVFLDSSIFTFDFMQFLRCQKFRNG